MLVIISDLHMTDGTIDRGLNAATLELFVEQLSQSAYQASWRDDGSYQPISQIDLVLLGDVLDTLHSAHWLRRDVRPWDATTASGLVETLAAITDNILQYNSDAAAVLRSLAAESPVQIPPAMRGGQPSWDGSRQAVPVRTHYMVGDHDAPFHWTGAGYDLIRQKVAHHLGLANPHNAAFPRDPAEGDDLLETLRRHRVFARHGDIFDPLHAREDQGAASLSNAIAIELTAAFLDQVQAELADDLPDSVLGGLCQITNVRPILLMPMWIEGLLERCCGVALRGQIKQMWDRHVERLLDSEIVKRWQACRQPDVLAPLAGILTFRRRPATGWADAARELIHRLGEPADGCYAHHAVSEPDFRNRRARHIVYGHTHHAETVPLDASYADEFVLNQVYHNAGTWRRVNHAARFAPGQNSFIPLDEICWLAFYQDGQRSGRSFESWTISLGASSVEAAAPRSQWQQAAAAAPAVAQGASSQLRPPHFRRVARRGGQPVRPL